MAPYLSKAVGFHGQLKAAKLDLLLLPLGAFIYDVRREGEGGQLMQHICGPTVDFVDKGGKGVNKSQNSADVIYGSPLPLSLSRSCAEPETTTTQSRECPSLSSLLSPGVSWERRLNPQREGREPIRPRSRSLARTEHILQVARGRTRYVRRY